jgi:hypothetical protein
LIDAWIIDFVDDAVAVGKPDGAARGEGGAEAIFGACCPAGWDAGKARGVSDDKSP